MHYSNFSPSQLETWSRKHSTCFNRSHPLRTRRRRERGSEVRCSPPSTTTWSLFRSRTRSTTCVGRTTTTASCPPSGEETLHGIVHSAASLMQLSWRGRIPNLRVILTYCRSVPQTVHLNFSLTLSNETLGNNGEMFSNAALKKATASCVLSIRNSCLPGV